MKKAVLVFLAAVVLCSSVLALAAATPPIAVAAKAPSVNDVITSASVGSTICVPGVGTVSADDVMKWMVIAQALSALGFLVLAMIIVALFTPQLGAVSSQIEKKPFNSFWWGVLFAVLLFPVTLILVISLVGIIFLPVWALLVVAASVFGYIAVSHVIGKKLLHALKLKSKPMMWEVVIGLCALWLVGLIPVLGCLIQCLACTCGFGAATLKRLGTV